MILDRFVPDFAFRERHSILIRASRKRVFEALNQLTPEHVPIARVLLSIRSLPAMLLNGTRSNTDPGAPFLRQYGTLGFILLGKELEREIVLGLVGQFWKPAGGICFAIKTPEDFQRFKDPDHVKVGWNFLAEQSEGSCTLITETRIQPTDRSARLKFSLYWVVVRANSGLLRRAMLRATKRLAEASV